MHRIYFPLSLDWMQQGAFTVPKAVRRERERERENAAVNAAVGGGHPAIPQTAGPQLRDSRARRTT
jgi:hypothetical protein